VPDPERHYDINKLNILFAGGAVLFILAGLVRSRREPRKYHIPKAPRRPMQHEMVSPPPDMPTAPSPAEPSQTTASDSDLPPVDLAPVSDGDEGVPDIVRWTRGGTSPDEPMEDFMNAPDALPTTTQTHPQHAPQSGYWTCKCGRKNPNSDTFCSRCNADRA